MQKNEKTAEIQAPQANQAKVDIEVKKKPPKRTAGLWLMDFFVYPVLNTAVVFLVSVGATYLTNNGHKLGEDKPKWVRSVGKWFHDRGNWVIDKFQRTGLSYEQADMAKMVTFSFLDGSVMAPVVKLLEDRREKIAKAIDTLIGTKPKDESVYEAEPKQSWKSVLLGRAVTASIVVPTAVALDKIKYDGERLNDRFFNNAGKKRGEKFVENNPKVAAKYPNVDIPDIFRVAYFEGFYTLVCSIGLYFSSRMIARSDERRQERREKVQEKYQQEQAVKADRQVEKPEKVAKKEEVSEAVTTANHRTDTIEEEEKTKTAHAEKYQQAKAAEPELMVGA